MKITRDNYESFFMDYLEGNLQENLIDQFLDFLNQNPDLKEELHLFEDVNLPEEHVVFQEKTQLYKNQADENRRLENSVVAYLEGDLDVAENKAFEAYLAVHPELKKEYHLFAKTRLVPDSGIRYPHKQKLYRKPGYSIVLDWTARVAAVLVLIWGINSLYQSGNEVNQEKVNAELAELNPKPEPPVKKMETKEKVQEAEVQVKVEPEKVSKPIKTNRNQTNSQPEGKRLVEPKSVEPNITALAEISPINARLELVAVENQLAVKHSINVLKINDPVNPIGVEEFLASRVKKVGNEGLLSAQRIARLGLNLASELSGERIEYSVKDGKIARVGFESKLMAFSIPLEKK